MIFRQEKHPSKRRQQVHRYYVIIAAAVLVLIGGGLGIVLSRNSRPETKEASLTKEQKELYRMAGPHIETQKERIERVRMEATGGRLSGRCDRTS